MMQETEACRDLTHVLIMTNHGPLKKSSGSASVLTVLYAYAKPCQPQLYQSAAVQ